jgi:hypothetical protein
LIDLQLATNIVVFYYTAGPIILIGCIFWDAFNTKMDNFCPLLAPTRAPLSVPATTETTLSRTTTTFLATTTQPQNVLPNQ